MYRALCRGQKTLRRKRLIVTGSFCYFDSLLQVSEKIFFKILSLFFLLIYDIYIAPGPETDYSRGQSLIIKGSYYRLNLVICCKFKNKKNLYL